MSSDNLGVDVPDQRSGNIQSRLQRTTVHIGQNRYDIEQITVRDFLAEGKKIVDQKSMHADGTLRAKDIGVGADYIRKIDTENILHTHHQGLKAKAELPYSKVAIEIRQVATVGVLTLGEYSPEAVLPPIAIASEDPLRHVPF